MNGNSSIHERLCELLVGSSAEMEAQLIGSALGKWQREEKYIEDIQMITNEFRIKMLQNTILVMTRVVNAEDNLQSLRLFKQEAEIYEAKYRNIQLLHQMKCVLNTKIVQRIEMLNECKEKSIKLQLLLQLEQLNDSLQKIDIALSKIDNHWGNMGGGFSVLDDLQSSTINAETDVFRSQKNHNDQEDSEDSRLYYQEAHTIHPTGSSALQKETPLLVGPSSPQLEMKSGETSLFSGDMNRKKQQGVLLNPQENQDKLREAYVNDDLNAAATFGIKQSDYGREGREEKNEVKRMLVVNEEEQLDQSESQPLKRVKKQNEDAESLREFEMHEQFVHKSQNLKNDDIIEDCKMSMNGLNISNVEEQSRAEDNSFFSNPDSHFYASTSRKNAQCGVENEFCQVSRFQSKTNDQPQEILLGQKFGEEHFMLQPDQEEEYERVLKEKLSQLRNNLFLDYSEQQNKQTFQGDKFDTIKPVVLPQDEIFIQGEEHFVVEENDQVNEMIIDDSENDKKSSKRIRNTNLNESNKFYHTIQDEGNKQKGTIRQKHMEDECIKPLEIEQKQNYVQEYDQLVNEFMKSTDPQITQPKNPSNLHSTFGSKSLKEDQIVDREKTSEYDNENIEERQSDFIKCRIFGTNDFFQSKEQLIGMNEKKNNSNEGEDEDFVRDEDSDIFNSFNLTNNLKQRPQLFTKDKQDHEKRSVFVSHDISQVENIKETQDMQPGMNISEINKQNEDLFETAHFETNQPVEILEEPIESLIDDYPLLFQNSSLQSIIQKQKDSSASLLKTTKMHRPVPKVNHIPKVPSQNVNDQKHSSVNASLQKQSPCTSSAKKMSPSNPVKKQTNSSQNTPPVPVFHPTRRSNNNSLNQGPIPCIDSDNNNQQQIPSPIQKENSNENPSLQKTIKHLKPRISPKKAQNKSSADQQQKNELVSQQPSQKIPENEHELGVREMASQLKSKPTGQNGGFSGKRVLPTTVVVNKKVSENRPISQN